MYATVNEAYSCLKVFHVVLWKPKDISLNKYISSFLKMQTSHGLHPLEVNEKSALLLLCWRYNDMRNADIFATSQPVPYGLKT